MTKSFLMENHQQKSTTPVTAAAAKCFEPSKSSNGGNFDPQQHQIHHNNQMMDHDNSEWFPGCVGVENHGMSSANINYPGVLGDEPALLASANLNMMPPMAYMNGNSVRPIRRRHFSQQQTGGSIQDDHDGAGQQQQQQLTSNHDQNLMETETKPPKFPPSTSIKSNGLTSGFDKSEHHHYNLGINTIIKHQEQFVSGYSNNDMNICDLSSYDNNNDKQWINRLAKGIEKVLRMAKETRRLKCTELLVPNVLTTNIAEDILELAECEPCGLRGCLLLICIENNDNNNNQQKPAKNFNKNTGDVTAPSSPLISTTTKLLGEFSIDTNVVPTFEVFLTLKRVEPSWFELLENKFLNKTQIILSEVYLLNKKKLYQTSSPIL